MIGAAIGAGIGAVGSIFGGLKASKAMKKMRQNIEAQRKKNEDWYNRNINEDATQRGDAQALLEKTEESILRRNRSAAGRAAVTGGTDEQQAAAREANAQALSQTMGTINAAADARKDQVEQTYRQKDDAYQEQLNQLQQGKAQSIAEATKGVTQAAGSIGTLFDSTKQEQSLEPEIQEQ